MEEFKDFAVPSRAAKALPNSGTCAPDAVENIRRSYRAMIKNPECLEKAANYLYQSLLDDAIVGVLIEVHRLHKSGNLEALDGDNGRTEESPFRMVDKPDCDIFGNIFAKKPIDVTCPNCNRPVSAGRFAKHMAKCMGMDRKSRSSKRLGTKEGTSASSSSSSSYLQLNDGSDDEDDAEEKRRRRPGHSSRNYGFKKKNGKSF